MPTRTPVSVAVLRCLPFVTLSCALAACGVNGKAAADSPAAPTESAATQQPITVRLTGINATGPVLVKVATLELLADGRRMDAQLGTGEVDLSETEHAAALATFELPPDAQKIAVNVRFDGEGSVQSGGTTRSLDVSGPPIELSADAAQSRSRGKVVLEVDVARSLVEQDGKTYLLPSFTVRY